jgi:lycopene beta-cyclase
MSDNREKLNVSSPPKAETEGAYDYIIAGAGCAGLSLAIHMIHSEKFRNKKILIVDQDKKTQNDRTWCFWQKENGLFESIVYKEWQHCFFHSDLFSTKLNIEPYSYKLIRGIDFYNYSLKKIKENSNFSFLQGNIKKVFSNENETGIIADDQKYVASFVFNSLLPSKPELKKGQHWLLQHFKGWFIETSKNVFDPSLATLMDFRTRQSNGTSFFYVLPFSPNRALVEYTLFSKKLLKEDQYEEALKNYIEETIGLSTYRIEEKEFGVIPMTDIRFSKRENNCINIGTAGGQTKGSSGYTFNFIQKHSAAIVDSLFKYGHPFSVQKPSNRFQFYDSILLSILDKGKFNGADIFTDLFKKNQPEQVLKFLDNETSITEELNIIRSLPILPFSKAAFRKILS